MTTHYRMIAAVAAFTVAGAVHADHNTRTPSVSRPVAELQYGPTGLSDGVHGELTAAPAYGDLAHGPHVPTVEIAEVARGDVH